MLHRFKGQPEMAAFRVLYKSFPAFPRALPCFYCSTENTTKPLLTLYTKRNEHCALCETAKEILRGYSTRFAYEECYIDDPSNKAWFEKYKYDIPVIHINGQFLMKHKVNEQLLETTLDNYTIRS